MTSKQVMKAVKRMTSLLEAVSFAKAAMSAKRSRLNPWRRKQRNKDLMTTGLITMGILALAGNTLYALHHFKVIDLNKAKRDAKKLARRVEETVEEKMHGSKDPMQNYTQNTGL